VTLTLVITDFFILFHMRWVSIEYMAGKLNIVWGTIKTFPSSISRKKLDNIMPDILTFSQVSF